MIVEKPQISAQGEEILVSAAITSRSSGADMPKRLWFRVSNRFQDGVTRRSDPFLLALLPVAMALGEGLEIEGTVSPRLVFGLRDYQKILHTWWPKHFSVIDVTYGTTSDGANNRQPKSVGSSFSGGIDSFFTLHRHRGAIEVLPEYRLTHCLMIDGFDNDVDLGQTGLFQTLRDVYEPMFSALGIQLVVRAYEYAAVQTGGNDTRKPASDSWHAAGFRCDGPGRHVCPLLHSGLVQLP